MTVTRFAPSPTGYIHIGNVRSAIYPYLLSCQDPNGKFILRIEDTDQARYVDGATDLIMETLKWLGLDWTEGAYVGGPKGPYYQSERKEIYHEYARKLIAAGRAYADTTSPEQVDKYRKADNAAKVPYLYRNHRPTETVEWEPGIPLRFKADPKNYSWHDEVMGDLSTGPEVLDDIILIKKDGLPTYNFAHIVDDFEMGVTHIMRGVEYLPSTPNYLAIYEALGIDRPKLVSLPHILAPTGNKKLGKRDGAKSVTEYKDDGVLPEAMLNYLANLGWNDGTEQEIYTKEEMIKAFSLDHVQNSGARYDETKLLWMNGMWIRKIADEQGIDELYDRTVSRDIASEDAYNMNPTRDSLIDFWPKSAQDFDTEYQKRVLSIVYDRLKVLSDLKTATPYFFEKPEINLEMLEAKPLKKLEKPEMAELLKITHDKLIKVTDWNESAIQTTLNELLESTGKKPAELFSLIRIAISFAPFSPALNLTMEVIGKERVLSRLSDTITAIENA